MFGKRGDSKIQGINKVNTILGEDAEFSGNIKAKGILQIDGKLDGQIENSGDVIITEKGAVDADLKAYNATIAGTYRGTLDLNGALEIKTTGKVLGDIKVAGIVIEEGGMFDGNCEMKLNKKTPGVKPEGVEGPKEVT
jgi:cytoskeletal protein CcmA (bactofilin family)